MKWQGRQGSDNVEDRRGISTGKMALGGGIGTIIIVLVVLLLGGDPSKVLNVLQQGGPATESGPVTSSPEEDEMVQFVKVVLGDTEKTWGKLFADAGSVYRQPKLVLFRGQIESACGFATSASGPFYCPGDEKVYLDISFFEDLKIKFGAYGDFAVAYVIAHEVGHHVQNQLGILKQVSSKQSQMSEKQANQLQVRVELQADFFAGLWAHYEQDLNYLDEGDIEEAMNAAASVGDDVLQEKYQGRVVPDKFTHGSAEQRKNWFLKGLTTGKVDLGNTFDSDI
jgi:uncharacterized protein